MPSRQTAAPARPEHVAAALRGLLSYMSRTRFALIAVAVLVCVSGGANLLGTYMIKPVVNAIEDGDPQRFLAGVAFTAGIYLTGVVACFGYSQIMVRVAQKVVSDIRRDLFARIERLPLSFFDRTRHGDVMSCFTNDVDTVSEALNNSFANLVQAGVQIVGTITLLLVLDWRLTLITLVCDGAIALYVRFSGGRSRRIAG
uniref:ABC transporter transmembrane domain-containing protein n=1 Tax=uncultured Bifidobacterium sp. TaxID=165187 RepID=UPI0025995361